VAQRMCKWLDAAGGEAVERVYSASTRLDLESTVVFARALCEVSWEELHPQAGGAPRIFSLQKLVEVAHFNLLRIRMIWSRVWPVFAAHLVAAGSHSNASVALFAVDSLRQLAHKLLDRAELAHYTFQNEALKPFATLIGRTSYVVVRELIVRCMSQLLQAHWGGICSGWRSVFMVFTSVGEDPQEAVVVPAFKALEPAIMELFNTISGDCFADCVNCLTSFAHNRHNVDISLQALRGLTTCGHRLAAVLAAASATASEKDDTVLTPAVSLPAGGALASPPGAISRSASDALCSTRVSPNSRLQRGVAMGAEGAEMLELLWLPLLASLSQLSSAGDIWQLSSAGDSWQVPQVRAAALDALFGLLHEHGRQLSAPMWQRLAESTLFPLLDPEVHEDGGPGPRGGGDQDDTWFCWRCEQCLAPLCHLLGSLHDHPGVAALHLDALTLLEAGLTRAGQAVARVAAAAMMSYLDVAAAQLSDAEWAEVLQVLRNACIASTPSELVPHPNRAAASAGFPQGREDPSAASGRPRGEGGDDTVAPNAAFPASASADSRLLSVELGCRQCVTSALQSIVGRLDAGEGTGSSTPREQVDSPLGTGSSAGAASLHSSAQMKEAPAAEAGVVTDLAVDERAEVVVVHITAAEPGRGSSTDVSALEEAGATGRAGSVDVRQKCITQLILQQLMAQLCTRHAASMPFALQLELLDLLSFTVDFASIFNHSVHRTCATLPGMHPVSLLRQEVEGGLLYLETMVAWRAWHAPRDSDSDLPASIGRGAMEGAGCAMAAEQQQEQARVALQRIGWTCEHILKRAVTAGESVGVWQMHDRAMRSPVVAAAVRVLSTLPQDVFVERAGAVYPLLACLTRDDSLEVRRAVSDAMTNCVGPLILAV
ncbi:hypothetical protein CYMTET_17295, partial [Cymbomonas tetramitiformis]